MKKNENKNDFINPKSYIKRGFWISFGFGGGVVALGIVFIVLSSTIVASYKHIGNLSGNIQDVWDNITLNKEQKQFKSCYKRKEITHKGYWLWKGREKYIPYYISALCEEEGYKASGRFLEQYKRLENDICKNLMGGIDC
jgi:hypothetical protein